MDSLEVISKTVERVLQSALGKLGVRREEVKVGGRSGILDRSAE